MMMEAIRLSLAAEEERKRREEKDARKEEKKKAKEEKKAAKQAEKAARKRNGSASLYHVGTNDSNSSWASTSMARSTSNLGTQPTILEEQIQGKGKEPIKERAGASMVSEETSNLSPEVKEPQKRDSDPPNSGQSMPNPINHPQRHLAASRANLQPTSSTPIPMPSPRSPHIRQLSNASSAASSFVESPYGSVRGDSNLPSGNGSNLDVTAGGLDGSPMLMPTGGSNPTIEPMFNFRSLAAMIGEEDKVRENEHIETAGPIISKAEEELKEPSPTGSPRVVPLAGVDGNRSRGDSGDSSASPPPPIYVEAPVGDKNIVLDDTGSDQITQAPPPRPVPDVEKKGYDESCVNVLDHGHGHVHGATQ